MIPYIGDFAEDAEVYHYFNTFDSNDPSASVTATDLLLSDIFVYKDGSITDIVTDGATVTIDFDGRTGLHKITIATNAHADYSTGSDYMVMVNGITVDGATINAGLFSFSIQNRYNTVTLAAATQASIDAMEVDVTSILADTDELQLDDIPGKIAALDAVVDTVKDETALIVGDTDELQTNQGNWLTATGFATPINITAATGITLAASTGLGTQSGTVGGIAGTITTLDALDTAQDTKHDATVSTGNSAWATVTGHATPTNITAGTMTTVTNLTNAATAGDLTAVMKTSVNTEADTAITDGALATAAALAAAKVDTAAIKVKTDLLTFTVGTRIDAQMLGIKGKTITGTGTAGDEYDVT